MENGRIAAKPVGREAVEDLVASETPRGALPGIRRALDGPLSAFLTGRTRGPDGAPPRRPSPCASASPWR